MFSGTKIDTYVFLHTSPFFINLKYGNWYSFFYLYFLIIICRAFNAILKGVEIL